MKLSDELLLAIRSGRKTRAALLSEIRMTESVFDQLLVELGPKVLWLGHGENAVLACRRAIRGHYLSYPLYYIDRHGQDRLAAMLHPVDPRGWVLELFESVNWPSDESGNLSMDGLPYFLYELLPDGFMGQNFARYFGKHLEVASDPKQWTDEDILHVLSRRGIDLPGNFVLGDAALARLQSNMLEQRPIPELQEVAHYRQQIEDYSKALLNGNAVKPSAVVGGAQPKLTAFRTLNGESAHVIVKYAKKTGGSIAQRWSDLLVSEHLALTAAREHLGAAAPLTRILQDEHYTYLEIERFDRVGANGRLPVCSWSHLNAGIVGSSEPQWPKAMKRLYDMGLMEPQQLSLVITAWLFGKLIANTDMHDGNIALMPKLNKLAIAPLYDMLPMAYAPKSDALPTVGYEPYPKPLKLESQWSTAAKAAGWFWRYASTDDRLSDEFRAICRENLEKLKVVVKGAA